MLCYWLNKLLYYCKIQLEAPIKICNSVTYPGSCQVFNFGFACGRKRQDSSDSIVTSGEFKDYCLSLSRDTLLLAMERLISRPTKPLTQWSFLPRKQRPGLEADFPPPSRAEWVWRPICTHVLTIRLEAWSKAWENFALLLMFLVKLRNIKWT